MLYLKNKERIKKSLALKSSEFDIKHLWRDMFNVKLNANKKKMHHRPMNPQVKKSSINALF